MKNEQINILALAYLGDSVYEIEVRKFLINKKIVKVNNLNSLAINYVSARAQAKFLEKILENNLLTEKELSIVQRARNHKGNRHPKNTDILTYKHATALEAVIGYLYLEENYEKIEKIMKFILGE